MYIMYFIYGAVDFKIVQYRKGSMDGGGGGLRVFKVTFRTGGGGGGVGGGGFLNLI